MIWRVSKYLGFFIAISLAVAVAYFFYPDTPLPKDTVIDKIVVLKSERKLKVYSKGELIKTYRISLGLNPVGPKRVEGDMKPRKDFIISTARILKVPIIKILESLTQIMQTESVRRP